MKEKEEPRKKEEVDAAATVKTRSRELRAKEDGRKVARSKKVVEEIRKGKTDGQSEDGGDPRGKEERTVERRTKEEKKAGKEVTKEEVTIKCEWTIKSRRA